MGQVVLWFALFLSLVASNTSIAALLQPGEDNACNSGLMEAICKQWGSLLFDTTKLVTIPCGVCVEITRATNIVLPQGINVEGRLRIAPPPGEVVRIYTRAVLVQGVLSIDTPYYPRVNPMTGESATVNFIMTSTGEDFQYTPFGINADACSGPCNAGTRPIVIAGGRLDIRGLPDDCAAWKYLERVDLKQVPCRQVGPSFVPPTPGCSLDFVREDFEGAVVNWYGQDEAQFRIREDSIRGKYAEVTSEGSHQKGARISMDIADTTCLVADTIYLFSAYIKLHSNTGDASLCSTKSENCPYVRMNRRDCPDAQCPNRHTRILLINKGFLSSDDVWHQVTGTMTFSEEDLNGGEHYHYIFIDGTEPGIDMAFDDFTLRRLPEAYFATDTCENVVINGDAELDKVNPYPLTSRDAANSALLVMEEQAGANQYFRLTNRVLPFDRILFQLSQAYMTESATYAVSILARASSAVKFYLRLSYPTTNAEGNTDYNQIPIVNCEAGVGQWRGCSGTVTLTDPVIFEAAEVFLDAPINSDIGPDIEIDFDDVKFSFKEGPVASFVVDATGAQSCWQPGSTLLLTSDTMTFEHATVATIESVHAVGNGMAAISFEESMTPRSARQPEGFPIEIALLDRNIKFESNSDGTTEGGHLMVFQTADVYQHLEGVELFRFGQRGVLGRYPMHIHLSEYLTAGTIFKKNLVRMSNQRCIVVHGSHNATIEENVAFETFGHCFMLEDGAEIDNSFIRNLGASQRDVEENELVREGESDDHSSTFWCTNPVNTWIGNVAAGGTGSGFWFEIVTFVKSPSIPVTEGSLLELNLTAFVNNSAHSYRSKGIRMYPNGYRPLDRARFENIKSFKNRDSGMFLHNSWNLGLYGGVFADNRRQMEIHRADDIIVHDVDVIGQTQGHMNALAREASRGHCAVQSNTSLHGVTIHSFLFNPEESPRGPSLRNVRFSDINDDNNGCIDSSAIYMHEDEIRPNFDSWTLFEEMTFTNVSLKFSMCKALAEGVTNVIMEETGKSIGLGPGFLLSENQPELTAFLPTGSCSPLPPGSCAIYCPGVCLRTLKIKVEPTVSANMILRVQSNSTTTEILGHVQGYDPTYKKTYRTYSAILPPGQYFLSFVEAGVETWPTAVFEEMGEEPQCSQGESWFYTLRKPSPPNGFCDTLISDTVKNGNIESGLDYWKHRSVVVGINRTEGGFQSAHALTTSQAGSNSVGQLLDTRCMEVGQEYQLEARVRIVDEVGATFQCDPNSRDSTKRCTYANVLSSFIDPSTNNLDTDYRRVAYTLSSTQNADWKVLHGVFTVTEHMAASTDVFLYFQGAPKFALVDRVSLTKVDRTGLPLILNGNLEAYEDDRYFFRSGTNGYVMESPGADGSAAAISTDTAGGFVRQIIPSLKSNTRYHFTAKFKLSSSSGTCRPTVDWGDAACPKLTLYSSFEDDSLDEYKKYFFAVTPVVAHEWNTMVGYFTPTQAQTTADHVGVFVGQGPKDAILSIDDISLTEFRTDCSSLIGNGGVESGDTRYWRPRGANVVLELDPAGSFGAALAIRQRSASWKGAIQEIDMNCIVAGAQFHVMGYLKLWDANSNSPFNCTVGQSGGNEGCPTVGIEMVKPDRGGSTYMSIANEETSPWVADSFNLFTASFSVTDEMVASAAAVKVYLSGPAAGIDIIADAFIMTSVGRKAPFSERGSDAVEQQDIANSDGQRRVPSILGLVIFCSALLTILH